jgi:hypothetical protein
MSSLPRLIVNPAVQLDDELQMLAIEIHNEATHGHLTAEFQPVEPLPSQGFPKNLLRRGHRLPQPARAIPRFESHPQLSASTHLFHVTTS